MPSDPARETALAAVKTALEVIGSDRSRYHATRVPTVYRDERNAESLASGTIYFSGQEETIDRQQYAAVGAYLKTLTISGVYIEDYPSDDSSDEYRAKMAADIEYALREWTLGGACSQLDVTGNATLALDASDTSPQVGIEFTLVLQYRTRRDDPATKV